MEEDISNRKRAKLPTVRMAVFCESALQDKDGLWSVIRVMDRITVRLETTPSPLESNRSVEFPPVLVKTNLVVMLQNFSDTEPVELVLTANFANKRNRETLSSMVVTPSGEHRGMNLRFDLNLVIREPGRHWFELRIQNRIIVKLPLDVEVVVEHADPSQ